MEVDPAWNLRLLCRGVSRSILQMQGDNTTAKQEYLFCDIIGCNFVFEGEAEFELARHLTHTRAHAHTSRVSTPRILRSGHPWNIGTADNHVLCRLEVVLMCNLDLSSSPVGSMLNVIKEISQLSCTQAGDKLTIVIKNNKYCNKDNNQKMTV